MADRIQLTTTTYMILDGQPQLALSGSVIDVPDAIAFKGHTVLSPAETPAPLQNGKATSVRNVRKG